MFYINMFGIEPPRSRAEPVLAALRKAGGADYDSGQVEGCSEVVGEAPAKKEFTRPGRPGKGGARLVRKKPAPAAEPTE
jgi:hypothetical protein